MISIERVREWLLRNRTENEYAFSALDIAIGVNGPPAAIALLCAKAAAAGMLASTAIAAEPFYTHPLVGMEAKIGSRKIQELLAVGQVIRKGDHYEWTPPKKVTSE